MHPEAVKSTSESYQLTPHESQFLETLKNTQGDIFETLDKKEVFYGLKEIPNTILREQLAEQQLLQLFPKSHKLRQIINQFDHEMAYFKMRYSDPIIVQRFADASGKTFDEAKEYLDNILVTARIIPKIGSSKTREQHNQNLIKEVHGRNLSILEKNLLKYCTSGFFLQRMNRDHFIKTEKIVYAEPEKSIAIHELAHLINSGYRDNQENGMNNIKDLNIEFNKSGFSEEEIRTYLILSGGVILCALSNLNLLAIAEVVGGIGYFSILQSSKNYTDKYFKESKEIHSIITQIRYFNNIKPGEAVTRGMIMNHYDALPGLLKEFIDRITYQSKQKFIHLLNTSF